MRRIGGREQRLQGVLQPGDGVAQAASGWRSVSLR